MTGGPDEWTVICNGSSEGFLRALQAAHGEVLEESEATFEEIFHARAGEVTAVEENTTA